MFASFLVHIGLAALVVGIMGAFLFGIYAAFRLFFYLLAYAAVLSEEKKSSK